MQVFLTIEEEFTDNANQTKENRTSEFRTSVAPGLSANIERPSTSVAIAYVPRFVFADERIEEADSPNHDLTLRAGWNPSSRIRLGLAEDLTKSSDFRDVRDPGSRVTGRREFLTNRATAEAAYTPGWGRLASSYTNIVNLNLSEDPGSEDSIVHTGRLGGELANPRLVLGGSYGLTRQDYEVSSPFWEHNLEAFARRILSPTFTGTLLGSFAHHDADEATAVDFNQGRAQIGLIWMYHPSGSVDAGAGADFFTPRDQSTKIRPSFRLAWTHQFPSFSLAARYRQGYEANFENVVDTGLSFTREAAILLSTTSAAFRNLILTLEGRWVENEFEVGTVGVTEGTRDQTWDFDVGLRYYVFRPLSITLRYSATLRTSTDPGDEFLENRIRLGLTYQYDIF